MEKKFITKEEKEEVFSSGAKRSDTSGKGRFDLISPFALKRLADVYERGGIIRGDRNWEKGLPIARCLDSSIRHINQFLSDDQGEDHLAQACWNLFAIMHFQEMIKRGLISKDLNDLPNYNQTKGGNK